MKIKNWLKKIQNINKAPLDPEREAMRKIIRLIDKSYWEPDVTPLLYPRLQKTWMSEKVYEFFTKSGKMCIKADTYQGDTITGYFIQINGGRWMRFEADSKEGQILSKFRNEAVVLFASLGQEKVSIQQTLNMTRGR